MFVPHPLTDVGRQGSRPTDTYDFAECWGISEVSNWPCKELVPLSDTLGLCPEHRSKILP